MAELHKRLKTVAVQITTLSTVKGIKLDKDRVSGGSRSFGGGKLGLEYEVAHFPSKEIEGHFTAIEAHISALEKALEIHFGRDRAENELVFKEDKDAKILELHDEGLSAADISELYRSLGDAKAVARIIRGERV
jgi:hypothetical protein